LKNMRNETVVAYFELISRNFHGLPSAQVDPHPAIIKKVTRRFGRVQPALIPGARSGPIPLLFMS
jgi:hypothetical protein